MAGEICSSSNSKRIAKNAMFLYIRMIAMMLISLFTSREVLRILGIDDFGIYNVVAGVIILFYFFQSTLVNASQRYISYELGCGTEKSVQKSFSMSLTIHIIFCLFIVFLAETIGLWFLRTQLVIPENRMYAANIVYQFTIIAFVFNILRTPFNSSIIAYEHMSFYAYISVIEAMLKLGVVYLLIQIEFDKLATYAILLSVVSVLIFLAYWFYCAKYFNTCRCKLVWERQYLKDMSFYSGWTMLGSISNVTAQHGCNILLNMFCGLVANASFGIANQVSQAVYAFSSNVQVAFNPQITKLYSISNYKELYKLVFRSSLISYYLMLIISIPVMFRMSFFLGLWLEEVPYYASVFCVIMILFQMVDSLQYSLNTLIHATGIIRNYYIWLSTITFMCLPCAFLLLKMGCSPIIVIFVRLSTNIITSAIRIFYMKHIVVFPLVEYLRKVLFRVALTTIIAVLFGWFLNKVIVDSFVGTVIYSILLFFVTAITAFTIGLYKSDRTIIFKFVKEKINGKKSL